MQDVIAILLIFFPLIVLAEKSEFDALAKVVMEGVWKNNLTIKQYRTAKTACIKQALEGDPEAQYHLGGLNTVHVDDIFPNHSDMWKWMKLSAENGYAKAQGFMGRAYEINENYLREKNISLAIKWHTLAAEQHDIASIVRLEEIYRKGLLGVEVNLEKAKYWATKMK